MRPLNKHPFPPGNMQINSPIKCTAEKSIGNREKNRDERGNSTKQRATKRKQPERGRTPQTCRGWKEEARKRKKLAKWKS
jgi:hypothetical protein